MEQRPGRTRQSRAAALALAFAIATTASCLPAPQTRHAITFESEFALGWSAVTFRHGIAQELPSTCTTDAVRRTTTCPITTAEGTWSFEFSAMPGWTCVGADASTGPALTFARGSTTNSYRVSGFLPRPLQSMTVRVRCEATPSYTLEVRAPFALDEHRFTQGIAPASTTIVCAMGADNRTRSCALREDDRVFGFEFTAPLGWACSGATGDFGSPVTLGVTVAPTPRQRGTYNAFGMLPMPLRTSRIALQCDERMTSPVDAGDAATDATIEDGAIDAAMDSGVDAADTPTDAPVDAPSDARDASVEAAAPFVRPAAQFRFNATLRASDLRPPLHNGLLNAGTLRTVLDPDLTTLRLELYPIAGSEVLRLSLGMGLMGESGTTFRTVVPTRPMGSPDSVPYTATVTLSSVQQQALQDGMVFALFEATDAARNGRGQLLLPSEEATVAFLSNEQVVPPSTVSRVGLANFIYDRNNDDFRVWVVAGADATSVSLLDAYTFTAGTTLLSLQRDPLDSTRFAARGNARGAVLASRFANRLSVQVNTDTRPTGASRGVFAGPGATVLAARLRGADVVPPVSSAASGELQLVLNFNQTSVSYGGAVAGFTPTSMAVHEAAAGTNGPQLFSITLASGAPQGFGSISAMQRAALLGPDAYATASSAMFPAGEIRGPVRVVAGP